MNRLKIYFFSAFIFFMNPSTAQEKKIVSIHWNRAATLPSYQEGKTSLGLAGAVIGVNDNILFVAGGANFPQGMPWQGGKKKYYSDGIMYKMDGHGKLIPGQQFQLPGAIAYAANCSGSEGIFIAGGENENGITNKVWRICQTGKEKKLQFENLPDLPLALANASMVCTRKKLYLAGGETADSAASGFYMLDLERKSAGWIKLPNLLKPLSHALMILQSEDGHPFIYLLGGRKKNPGGISEFYDSNLQYDLEKNLWSEKKSLPYALSAGTGIAVGKDFILLFGGDKGTTFQKVEQLIALIGKESDSLKKEQLIREKNELQSSHPGFSRDVLMYDTENDSWERIGEVEFDLPVTTTAVNWKKDVLIPSGEIRAGVRTPEIFHGKIRIKTK
jgi:N-acetylneuraminate epimerase